MDTRILEMRRTHYSEFNRGENVPIATVAVAIAALALAQSYNPDLGPAGNVAPPLVPENLGYPGYGAPAGRIGGYPAPMTAGFPGSVDRRQRRHIHQMR